MFLQEVRDVQRVLAVLLHAQRKSFQALQEQEGVERADAAAGIAYRFHARFHDKGKIAEGFVESHAVIAGRRVNNMRDGGVIPGELARVRQHARERGAVSADKLGGPMHDNVGSMLKWTA